MLRVHRGGKVLKRWEIEKIRRVRMNLIKLAGGECNVVGCHYGHWEALEFHHVNKRRKKFRLSGRELLRPEKQIQAEMNECVLLCPTHHKEIELGIIDHANLRDNVRHLLR